MKIPPIRALLQNPRYRNILLVLLFLPLVFIDNRSSHDWGDDFAQYIHQAKNIVIGLPQSETGFIYSQENYIGPTAYPAGFPILLAPVYALFGNSIKAFTIYISIFYFILAFICLYYFRRQFSETTAIVLSFIFIYNPQMLLFKQEIMSDLPFTVFLFLTFLLYRNFKLLNFKNITLFSLLLAFIIMIRSVGFVLLAAILTDQLVTLWRNRKQSSILPSKKTSVLQSILSPISLALMTLVFFFLFNSYIFGIPSSGSLRDYLVFYYSGNFLNSIPENLEHYVDVFRYIYTPEVGAIRFLSLITGSVFLAMTFLGFLRKVTKQIEVEDYFFIFYILILLVFPNNFSAFRLLIPIGILLLYYAALGFKSINFPLVPSGNTRVLILGAVMLCLFFPGIIHIAASRNTTLEGPQDKETSQVFSYISNSLPDSSTVVFLKPRALTLYTEKNGYADPFTQDPTLIHVQLMKIDADYILIHNQLTSESMKRYVRLMKSRATEVWKNRKFHLYKINPINPAELY